MRKSFILHLDLLEIIKDMTMEQRGLLLTAIYNFNLGENTELDFGMKMAFAPFKAQFTRDQEQYEKVCKRNRDNGNKPKKRLGKDISQKSQSLIPEAKKADNDNKNDSDNDNKNVNKNDSLFKTPEEARRALEENFKDLVMSVRWMEDVCMTQKITMPQALMAIEDFKGGCLLREEYKSLKELKDYFSYWLPRNKDRLFNQKPKAQEYSFKPKRI